MNINKAAFPTPVMGIGDSVETNSTMEYRKWKDKDNFYFEISIKVKNKGIEKYVKDGYAKYVCEIDCPSTFLRYFKTSDKPNFTLTIPRQDVARTVVIQCTATACKDFDKPYSIEGMNEDYEGFDIWQTKGNLLAFFGGFSFEADIDYEKVKNIAPIMNITADSNITDVRYILDSDKIEIHVPTDIFNMYVNEVKNQKSYIPIIMASLVCGALQHALYHIEDYSSKLWARTINYRLTEDPAIKALNIDPTLDTEDIPRLAQALVGNPNIEMFSSLRKITETLNDVD